MRKIECDFYRNITRCLTVFEKLDLLLSFNAFKVRNAAKLSGFRKGSNKTVNFKNQTFITNGDIKYLNYTLNFRLNIGILFHLTGV